MKKVKTVLILTILGILFSLGVVAQSPPPPPSDPSAGGNQPVNPSGAPIEPGTGILLVLAAGYGLSKVKRAKRSQSEE